MKTGHIDLREELTAARFGLRLHRVEGAYSGVVDRLFKNDEKEMGVKLFAPPAVLFSPRCDEQPREKPSIYLPAVCGQLHGDCFRPSLKKLSHTLGERHGSSRRP